MSRAEAAIYCGNTDPLITSIVCSLFIVKKNIQFILYVMLIQIIKIMCVKFKCH